MLAQLSDRANEAMKELHMNLLERIGGRFLANRALKKVLSL
jgi:hypothetical protein